MWINSSHHFSVHSCFVWNRFVCHVKWMHFSGPWIIIMVRAIKNAIRLLLMHFYMTFSTSFRMFIFMPYFMHANVELYGERKKPVTTTATGLHCSLRTFHFDNCPIKWIQHHSIYELNEWLLNFVQIDCCQFVVFCW